MASLNKVMLIGNLTRDVEMRFTPAGTGIANFGIACNRKWKDAKTGELKEEVTFVDIELFGKTAEVAQKYLAKGKSVFIEGRLKLDQWEDKGTGQKRSKLKVIGETLQFLSDGKQQPQAKPTAQQAPQADHDLGISDEGIPY